MTARQTPALSPIFTFSSRPLRIKTNRLKILSEFLTNASRAFSVTKDEKEAKRAQREAQDREIDLVEEVGQLTIEVDWLRPYP